MQLVEFSEGQQGIWCKAYLRTMIDKRLDSTSRLFALQFEAIWNILGKPKGLEYSERELGKMLSIHRSQVHICLKRLETFGYITIQPTQNRRKLYCPTEKLTGEQEKGIPPNQKREEGLSGSKSETSEYTLYNNPLEEPTYRDSYAGSPKWPVVKPEVAARLKELKLSLFLSTFEIHYKKHPIPLEKVLDIARTFAKRYNREPKLDNINSYLRTAFVNQEGNVSDNEMLLKEVAEVKKRRAESVKVERENSSHEYALQLAYQLNTDKKLVKSDLPENLVKRLETFNAIVVDGLGFIKRSRESIFYVDNKQPYLFTSQLSLLETLQRKGVTIPGIEKIRIEEPV